MDCVLKLENGVRRCTICGWVDPRPDTPAPRRNCRHPDAVRIRLTRELDAMYAEDIPGRDRAEVDRTLAVCFGGCPHFSGSTCTRYGSACTRRQRWIEILIFTGCDLAKTPRVRRAKPYIDSCPDPA